MNFRNTTSNMNIDTAIKDANRLLHPFSRMMSELKLKNDFRYGSGSGSIVVDQLLFSQHLPLKVAFWKPWNRWTSAIGYYSGDATHFNVRKFDHLTHQGIVANLLHEYAHYCGFHHGNNYKTEEKCLYSVPYYISENVGKWL